MTRFRYIPVFLLIVLAWPVASTYMAFKIRQYRIKAHVKQLLGQNPDSTIVILLKIPLVTEKMGGPDFRRFHAREFRYKGEMYDVLKQEPRNDTTWYWCIHDRQETLAYRLFRQKIAESMANDIPFNRTKSHLFTWLKMVFTIPPVTKPVTILHSTRNYIEYQPLGYSSVCILPPAPPPEA